MTIRSFISKNLISIVMVPVIIGGHYTWYTLQKDDRLVTAAERKKLPFSSLLFNYKQLFSWDNLEPASYDWALTPEFNDQVQMPPYTGEDFFYNFS